MNLINKILIAPDKFKGTLTAKEVCDVVERAILEVFPAMDVESLPLGDGGEGSLEIMIETLSLEKKSTTVQNPLFKPILSHYGKRKDEAYIEMALASGLQLLLDEDRNPMNTSSIGTGQLVLHAINEGAKKIFLFVGGSATIDGGMGLATALGYSFHDQQGNKLDPIGSNLSEIRHIERKNDSSKGIVFFLLTDVGNELLGPSGAAHGFAKQKGASMEEIKKLENGLHNFSEQVKKYNGRDISIMKGSGAAGGMAVSVVGLLNGTILPGTQAILEAANFKEKLKSADLVITGEGKIDHQTLYGKVVHAVTSQSVELGVPVIAICGINSLKEDDMQSLGAEKIISLVQGDLSEEYSLKNAAIVLEERVKELIRGRS